MSRSSNNFIHRIILLFFGLLYNEFAIFYDVVAWFVSAGQWNKWIGSSASFIKPGVVLELGHGTGHLQSHLLSNNEFLPYGIDMSKYMGKITSSRIQDNIRIARANAKALPFPSSTFDNVAATFPTEYISNLDTLWEVHRVLKKSGRLIILISAYFDGNHLLSKIFRWLYRITGETIDEASLETIYNVFTTVFPDGEFIHHEEEFCKLLYFVSEK